MIYFKDCRAKVWELTVEQNYTRANISTSEKDKDGNYVNSSWNASFVGKAFEKSKKITKGDNINILSGKVNVRTYEKDGKKVYYTNVTIFDFDMANNKQSKAEAKEITNDQEMPW